jgi:hypothetical protein
LPIGSDSTGWFWFNDAVTAANYIPSLIQLNPSVSAAGVGSSFLATKVGPGTDGVAGSAGSFTGCLDLGKSATKGDYSGGSAVFALPSCGAFKLKTSRTGDNLFQVSVSNAVDSSFLPKYAFTGGKGVVEVNLSDYVLSDKPIWVKITNGATGSLNIHGVDVRSYRLDCPTPMKSISTDKFLDWNGKELSFRCPKTMPVQVCLRRLDGSVVDIPFQGWVEAGVFNRLHLNTDHLPKGIYLIQLTNSQGQRTIKVSIGS